ncbi:MAG TPA: hypothetical protein VFA33_14985 [Bryobacteraceae bacterium]|nr:hypothetical protein [Bryobacteraceae bacterium]
MAERAVEKAALDRAWVLVQLRENVERSMQAVPVLDQEGTSTGEYRYEGAVANRVLESIGKELGMFKDQWKGELASGLSIAETRRARPQTRQAASPRWKVTFL